MKKKFFNFLLTLILVLPCSFIFAACEDEVSNHIHNSWDDCAECNEIMHLSQHKFELFRYDESTQSDVYRCSSCGFISHQAHKHVLDSYEIYPSSHYNACSICDYVASSYGVHEYGTLEHGWTSNCKFENGKAICECVHCGHKKTIDLATFVDTSNGSVEILDQVNNSFIIKPKVKEGYESALFFEKWEVTKKEHNSKTLTLDESKTEEFEILKPIFTVDPTIFDNSFNTYTFTPIFSEVAPTFANVEIVTNVENGIMVEVEHMLYIDQNGKTQISYYLPENNDVVLKKISIEHTETGADPVIKYDSTNYDGSLSLPLSSYCCSAIGLGDCEKVVFDFKDVRNRYHATVKYEIDGKIRDSLADSIIAKPDTFIADKTGLVTLEKGAQEIVGVETSYYYVEKWIDEQGNVVSTNKKFTTQITENRVFTAIMKKADEIEIQNSVVYLYSNNEDGTVTFEGLHTHSNAGVVIIPNAINVNKDNQKTVTGIGNFAFIPSNLQTYNQFVTSIEVGAYIGNFDKTSFNDVGICEKIKINNPENLTFEMFKNSKLPVNLAQGNIIEITPDALKNMIQKHIRTFTNNDDDDDTTNDGFNDIYIYSEPSLIYGLAQYIRGTNTLKLSIGSYSFATFAYIVRELRYFYQDIALNNIANISIENLTIVPTNQQINAWTPLDASLEEQNPNAYWFYSRNVDALIFTENLMGCNIFTN